MVALLMKVAPRLQRIVQRTVEVRPDEVRALLWSFLFFFFVLASYYMLRAVREERAVASGVASIPRLFRATFYVILAVTPVWAALVARVRRSLLLPLVYRFFIVNLVVFYALFRLDAWALLAAKLFFVWLSVYSLLAVAVFWSFMADIFTHEQSRRLFGFISAGGSAGAIAGPLLTSMVVERIDPASLLLVSAALLEGAARCVRPLTSWQQSQQGDDGHPDRPVGGSALAGIKTVFSSPYLLAIALYVVFATIAGTFGYVLQARLVAATTLSPAARTALFARMDLAANAITTVLQALVVGRLMSRLGVTASIVMAPPLMAASFAVQAVYPGLAASTALQVFRRAVAFGVVTPALHVLFTVVDREQKYKAKAFIDIVVYRGGDVLGSSAVNALFAAGLAAPAVALAVLPVGAVWLAVAALVGKRHRRLAQAGAGGDLR
jgi:AAA family ATP:ADP antiporter